MGKAHPAVNQETYALSVEHFGLQKKRLRGSVRLEGLKLLLIYTSKKD